MFVIEENEAFVSSILVGDGNWNQNGETQTLEEWLDIMANIPLLWDEL